MTLRGRGRGGEGAVFTSFRFASSLSATDWVAFFSLSFWRSSSSLAFFSSSVNGAIASVDSEKSVWSLVSSNRQHMRHTPHPLRTVDVRLARVVRRKVGVPKPLAAVVADKRVRACFSLDVDVRLLLVLFVGLGVGEQLVGRLVLVLLEPLERLVNCTTRRDG